MLPVGSICRLALSGLEVGVNSGLSNQNQNSVELKTLRSLRGDDADADVPPLGARAVALGDPVVVVDRREHLLEHALVVAAVVDVAGRRAVRELVGRDQVAAADVDAIDAEIAAPRGRRAARAPSC